MKPPARKIIINKFVATGFFTNHVMGVRTDILHTPSGAYVATVIK
jgi:hypothetical protein